MLFRPAHLFCLVCAAPVAASACGDVAAMVRVAGVSDGGELALADGRRARLGGLALAPAARGAIERLKGREVGLALLAARPDRWGRLVVDLVQDGGRSLGLDLVEQGLARVRPEPETRGCEAERLDAEAGARAAAEGLWAAPDAVFGALDGAGLAKAEGRFVLVDGVVRRVGVGRAKVYLEFGGRDGFAVAVARKAEPQFRRAGVDLMALTGQRVLVRGVVEVRYGPRMEIADPAMIEPLDPVAGRRE
jgi:hypothetical protein